VAVGSRGVPPLEVGVDGSVVTGYQHPAWFAPPRGRSDDCFEIVSFVRHLRPPHESGLFGRQVGREIPGVPTTGKRVEVGVVGIITFENGKIASEHLYWDHASVLAQLGILDPAKTPVKALESPRTLLAWRD
jgi:hypothetical protein